MKQLFAIFVTLILVGCKTTQPTASLGHANLLDMSFPGYESVQLETEQEVFGLSKEAEHFVDRVVWGIEDPIDRAETLVRSIFDRTDFNLLYDGGANTVAADTFANKTANCLSLSVLTYSMAQQAGLTVKFREIEIPEYWTRRDGYSLLNGHINLLLVPKGRPGVFVLRDKGMVVDFDPFSPKRELPARDTDKKRVLAMFYNNKGADALVNQDFTTAYAYIRQSILTDNEFKGSWINLGILYRFTGHYDWSEKTYQQVLALDPDSLTTMENMAILYQHVGRERKYRDIMDQVRYQRRNNPYYHYIKGEEDFDNGDYEQAITHFRRATRLDDDKHEFYFGLAKSFAALGDVDNSQRYLRRAKRASPFEDVRARYQSKLDLLSRL